MPFRYELKPNGGDSHQMAPYWLAAFVRYFYRDTYNRDLQKPGSLTELSGDPSASVREQPEILVVADDCISWQTSSSKQSHVSSASLTLIFTNTDYLSAVVPDDWMFFWAFNNHDDYARVRQALKEKKRINGFMDGIKFMGRVQSVFRTLVRNPQKGYVQVQYEIQGSGFTELDSYVYYNEAIARKYPSVLGWMSDFGTAANEFIVNGSIDANDAIPKLLRITLGMGPGTATKELVTTDLQSSPNDTYLIPATVAKLTMSQFEQQAKPVGVTYADLLKQFIGVQRYSGTAIISLDGEDPNDFKEDTSKWRGFIPDYKSNTQRTYPSPTGLTGEFLPMPLQFNKVSVWSLLSTYLNAPINEMYTCLRVDETGHVVPTLITRQIPFSSNKYVRSGEIGTSFLDLPRWSINRALVQNEHLGRTNAARFNYCQILGITPYEGATVSNQQINAVNNPPIVDKADIYRSGLRMYTAQVGAKVVQTDSQVGDNPGSTWTKLMTDMLFGSHLKYSGTLTTKLVQEPIVEGDNAEYDGVVYHIERVMHQGVINQDGTKEATTTLQLSNGISAKSDKDDNITVYPDLSTSSQESTPNERWVLDENGLGRKLPLGTSEG